MIIFVNKMTTIRTIPIKFQNFLQKAESLGVNTKIDTKFADIYNQYLQFFTENTDLYDSKIKLKSLDEYRNYITLMYELHHGFTSPLINLSDMKQYHQVYTNIVNQYNTKIDNIQKEEYQRTLAIVQEIIMRGQFGNQGYNTKTPHANFNKLFSLETFRRFRLEVEDMVRLFALYQQKYNELQEEANRNRKMKIEEAKRKCLTNT